MFDLRVPESSQNDTLPSEERMKTMFLISPNKATQYNAHKILSESCNFHYYLEDHHSSKSIELLAKTKQIFPLRHHKMSLRQYNRVAKGDKEVAVLRKEKMSMYL